MPNAGEGSDNLKELAKSFEDAAKAAKKFIGAAVAGLIGKGFSDAYSTIKQINEGLGTTKNAVDETVESVKDAEKATKEAGKTAEKTTKETDEAAKKAVTMSYEAQRAYNTALYVMGKTADEIRENKNLQAVFKELRALGMELALPAAAQGQKAIENIETGLMKLKTVATYAMQWIYYRTQEVAAGPLAKVNDTINSITDWFKSNMQTIASSVATAIGYVVRVFNAVVYVVGRVLKAISDLPPAIQMVGAAVLTVYAAIRSKMVLVSLIIGGILLLIEDLVTYMEGGDSLFGGFWGPMLEWAGKVKPVIEGIISALNNVITKIGEAWTQSSSLTDFVKHLALGEDYTPDASWETVGGKIWETILKGFEAGENWLFGLLFPNGVPDNIGGDWAKVAKNIVGEITNALDGDGLLGFVKGFIDGITATLTEKNPETGGLAEGLQAMFQGVLDGIVEGIGSVTADAGKVVNSLSDLIAAIFSKENLNAAFGKTASFAGNLFTAIGDAITAALNGVGAWDGTDIGTDLGDAASNIITAMFSAVETLTGNEGIEGLPAKIMDGLENALGTATDAVTGFLTAFLQKTFTPENIDTAFKAIENFGNLIMTAVGGAIQTALGALGDLTNTDLGTTLGSAVGNIVGKMFEHVGDLSQNIGITNLLTGIVTGLETAVPNAVDAIKTFLQTFFDTAFTKDNLDAAFLGITDLALNIVGALGSAIEAAFNGVSVFA